MRRANSVKYIENKIQNGIEYDIDLVAKEFKRLKIPRDVWKPIVQMLKRTHLYVAMSERAIGKTTNVLLLGMVFNMCYGTIIHYVRDNALMIENRHIKDLFSVIANPEYSYIEKLTDGEYNSVIYKSKRWYYCYINDNGDIEKICNKHFMICMSTDKSEMYKSTYTCETGDFIIYDEFIKKFYNDFDFFNFYDLHKTIARNRQSVYTFFLSNTIDINSPWFEELEIADSVNRLEIGENDLITTDLGTNIFVEIAKPTGEKVRANSILRQLYYGFKNPKLSAITGAQTWAVKEYQHIERGDKITREIIGNLYIEYYAKLVRVRIVETENLGLIIMCNRAKCYYDDSIIFTNNAIHDKQHRYGLTGASELKKAYSAGKFYFSTNSTGAIVEKFINEVI